VTERHAGIDQADAPCRQRVLRNPKKQGGKQRRGRSTNTKAATTRSLTSPDASVSAQRRGAPPSRDSPGSRTRTHTRWVCMQASHTAEASTQRSRVDVRMDTVVLPTAAPSKVHSATHRRSTLPTISLPKQASPTRRGTTHLAAVVEQRRILQLKVPRLAAVELAALLIEVAMKRQRRPVPQGTHGGTPLQAPPRRSCRAPPNVDDRGPYKRRRPHRDCSHTDRWDGRHQSTTRVSDDAPPTPTARR